MSLLLSLTKLSELQSFCDSRHMTLVMFSSPTCAPCKVLKPIIQRAAIKYPDEIGFVYVELNDTNQEVFNFYNIQAMPTIILFNKISPVRVRTGFTSETEIIDWLSSEIK